MAPFPRVGLKGAKMNVVFFSDHHMKTIYFRDTSFYKGLP